jgi:diguanylate cyclase (GGDEF)-like protein/putative nucleotidyltransferase with HDIG domain
MSRLPIAARLYVSIVVLAGAALLVREATLVRVEQPLLFFALFVLSALAAAFKVTLPLTASGSTMSVSYAVDFATLLMLGAGPTVFVAAGSALSQCLLNTKQGNNPLHRTLFSMASLVLTVVAAGWTLQVLGNPDSGDPLTAIARPLVGAATVYFLLNTGLVAAAIAFSMRQSVWSTWNTNFLWSAPSYFVGAGTAAVGAWFVTNAGYWLALLSFAPLYLTYRTYRVYMGRIEDEQRHVRETSDLHLATIEALARAIDAKDQTTQSHVRRVQDYAAGLATAAGLSPSDVQGVKTAALLHDIGKLAVPEHILSKPGPLTQEEFQKIRIHPQVGAEIISAVPFPYPVAPIILSHHERWDGKGYPQGLAGEDIPIGARILTIVDYYDAVTTERPYHKAMNHESALALLNHESGRALDPKLVDLFVKILPDMMAALELESPTREQARKAQADQGTTATGLVPKADPRNAYENIARAHKEIYALYEIAQTMGTSLGMEDTMTLVSSKLGHIVPWSGFALYLVEPNRQVLRCRFTSGIEADRLLDREMAFGNGLSGWAAQNRQTIVNGDPRVCFEAAGAGGGASLKSAIVSPLFSTGETVIGVLCLFHVEPARYNEDHRRLLERVAEQAGPVINNAVTFAQTQEDSLTDPLTSLPNRRSLASHVKRELSRADRLKGEVGLLLLDVDNFKSINDTFGHHVGDRALCDVAAALQQGLRPYDLCVRYAGDEFVIVLAECSREFAEKRRQELQQAIAGIELDVGHDRAITLGASIGAAVYPHDGTDYETLLASADHHMYRDKTARRSGRPSRADDAALALASPLKEISFESAPVTASVS